jgi:2,3-bisphosphoglycerate-dependent phosphoglycerate mutase
VVPFWNDSIAPAIRSGRQVVVAAHGNSLRALVKHLDRVGDEEIVKLNIPTARPLVYELDESLEPVRHYYLGDAAEIEAAMAAVAAQGKAR